MSSSHALRSRLRKDLSELIDNPYPGISVHHYSDDLHSFCLHLMPLHGPFAGLRLHFDARLPRDWPKAPPVIGCSTHLPHPNVFDSGWICCDLLRPEGSTQTGGYTPAFTLRGLLVQFLSFFSSDWVEQDYGGFQCLGNVGYAIVDPNDETSWHEMARWCQSHPAPKLRAEFEEKSLKTATPHMTRKFPLDGSQALIEWPCTPKRSCVAKIEWQNERYKQTLPGLRRFSCTRCKYNSAKFPVEILPDLDRFGALRIAPVEDAAPSSPPSTTNQLDRLSVELLLGISDLLPSESLIVFSQAYPRFAEVVSHHKVYVYRELSCFFLRAPITDRQTILGVGVRFDSVKKFVSSSFDWVSRSAFENFNVRTAVDKSPAGHFLPLAFGSIHFQRVLDKNALWPYLSKLARDTLPEPKQRGIKIESTEQQLGLRVLYRLCNHLAVQLMNTSEAIFSAKNEAQSALIFASEKVCIGYLQVYHLMVSILKSHPELRTLELQRLRKFRDDAGARDKAAVPDLGELLVCCAAVAGSCSASSPHAISWPEDLLAPFLREFLTRNVLWLLREHPELEALEAPSSSPSSYRLRTTFASCRTSYRLVMFQALFWRSFIVPHLADPCALETNFGFPPPGSGLAETMVQGIREIYEVATFTAFFRKIEFREGYELWVLDRGMRLGKELMEAVKRSAKAKYHRPQGDVRRLAEMRSRKEPGFRSGGDQEPQWGTRDTRNEWQTGGRRGGRR